MGATRGDVRAFGAACRLIAGHLDDAGPVSLDGAIPVCTVPSLSHSSACDGTEPSGRIWLIDLHRPLGIAILVLALLRVANRLRSRPPALPRSLPHWQVLAAKASHWALYALMLALPLIGWALLSAGGFPIVLFKGVNLPAIVPASPTLFAWLRDAHGLLARLLFVVVLVHLSAALVHAWIYRDGVFSSMARGGRSRG
ncbi:cytochrome b [Burkholderia cenocepacia]|uniref:cytochrome b n=1 Tax=Burkholderia cenocepacia TaxID=95486 RepID=UPI00286FF6E9|nr:cytochrome b [Burkholderia cenocepacia]